MSICEVKNCRQDDWYLTYYGHKVCRKHFEKHEDENDEFDLKKEFGIKG